MEIRRRHDNPNQNIGKLSGHYVPFNPYKQAFNETKKQAEKKEVSSPVDSQKKIDEMKDKHYLSRYGEQTKEFLRSKDGASFYEIHKKFTDLSNEIQNYGMKDFRKVMEYNREDKEEYDKNLAKLAEMFNQKEKVANPIKLQAQYNDLCEQTLHTLDPVIKKMEIRFETKLRELQKEMDEKYGSFSKYPEDVQRQINALQEKRSAYIETYLHERKSNEQTNDQLGQQLELSNDAMTAAFLQSKEKESQASTDRGSLEGNRDSSAKDVINQKKKDTSFDKIKAWMYRDLGDKIMARPDLVEHLSRSDTDVDLSAIARGSIYAFENQKDGTIHFTHHETISDPSLKPVSLDHACERVEEEGFRIARFEHQKVHIVNLEPSLDNPQIMFTQDQDLVRDVRLGTPGYRELIPGGSEGIDLSDVRKSSDRTPSAWVMKHIPDHLVQLDTPADNNNCGLYSMMGAVGLDMRSPRTKKLVDEVKDRLVNDTRIEEVSSKYDMLDFGSYKTDAKNMSKGSGERAFLILRDEKHIIEQGRGLRVYGRQRDGSIVVQDIIDSEQGKEPVCIYHAGKYKHFEALPQKVDASSRNSKVQNEGYFSDMPNERLPIRENKPPEPKLEKLLPLEMKGSISDHSLTELTEIKGQIIEKEKSLLEVGVPLNDIYKDVKENYPKIKDTAQSGEFLNKINYELSEKRAVDLITKMAPRNKESDYKQAIRNYCETIEKDEKFMKRIVDALGRNTDYVCETLYKDRKNINMEAFINQLLEHDSMPEGKKKPEVMKLRNGNASSFDSDHSDQIQVKPWNDLGPEDKERRLNNFYATRQGLYIKDLQNNFNKTSEHFNKEKNPEVYQQVVDLENDFKTSRIKLLDTFNVSRKIQKGDFYQHFLTMDRSLTNAIKLMRGELSMPQTEKIDSSLDDAHKPEHFDKNNDKDLAPISSSETKQRFVEFGKSMAINEADAQRYEMMSAKIYGILEGVGANEIVINRIMKEMQKDAANVRAFFDTSKDTEIDVDTVSNWLASRLEKRSVSPTKPPAAIENSFIEDSLVWQQHHPMIKGN